MKVESSSHRLFLRFVPGMIETFGALLSGLRSGFTSECFNLHPKAASGLVTRV